jgi:hypothetical protein
MKALTVLIFCFLGSVIAEDVDKDDEHLEQMAATIMQKLNSFETLKIFYEFTSKNPFID